MLHLRVLLRQWGFLLGGLLEWCDPAFSGRVLRDDVRAYGNILNERVLHVYNWFI